MLSLLISVLLELGFVVPPFKLNTPSISGIPSSAEPPSDTTRIYIFFIFVFNGHTTLRNACFVFQHNAMPLSRYLLSCSIVDLGYGILKILE